MAKKVKEFVDEVLVLHTGPADAFQLIKRQLPFAKVLDLPDLGIATLYVEVALTSASHNWILYLEDDYVPSAALLHGLRELITQGKTRLYRVNRVNVTPEGTGVQKVIMFFDKRAVRPTGMIHEHFFTAERFEDIDSQMYVEHRQDPLGFAQWLKKMWKYSLYSSLGIPYKLLTLSSLKSPMYDDSGEDLVRQKNLVYSIRLCDPGRNNFCLLLYELIYDAGSWLLTMIDLFKARAKPSTFISVNIYYLFLVANALRDIKLLPVSRLAFLKGNYINLFGLETYESARQALAATPSDLSATNRYFFLCKKALKEYHRNRNHPLLKD
ncbi:hypothetical protein [Tardisphaera saccharovorans]